MLQTLAVSGYRSLRDVVVPLGDLTVVTGPNGAGKSNLYRALRLLSAAGRGDLISAIAGEGGFSSVRWAGPQNASGVSARRAATVAVQLGFASDELGYLIDLGLPQEGERAVFSRDPQIKREQVFAGPAATPGALLIDRRRGHTRIRNDHWNDLTQTLTPFESILTDLGDGDMGPELLALRRMFAGWRFYDHFRTDLGAPARAPQVGTRTHTLSHNGDSLAATWATITDAGQGARLDEAVADAFPGARVSVSASDGYFRLLFQQAGLRRPLDASELSDGTLRYLLLCAALLSARPPALLVLNEPEASLHDSLIPPLARLIRVASQASQVIVVSHARSLVDELPARTHLELEPGADGTSVRGQDLASTPRWTWPAR